MNRRDVIAESILSTQQLLGRYLAGFDDTNHTRQAPKLPNHVAWNLGHLALTMHRVAERFDGRPVPDGDFIIGDLTKPPADPHGPRGDKGRFHTETVAFGSVPSEDPARYPTMARCTEIFHDACDRLAAAVRAADEASLDRTVKWGAGEAPLWTVAMRMVYHNGTHSGEIADLRRALGFKSIFA